MKRIEVQYEPGPSQSDDALPFSVYCLEPEGEAGEREKIAAFGCELHAIRYAQQIAQAAKLPWGILDDKLVFQDFTQREWMDAYELLYELAYGDQDG
jgi:hypothetical protein